MKQFVVKFRAEIICTFVLMFLSASICGVLFRCGCTFLWAGGWESCNVHNPFPPHCPWCSGPLLFRGLPFLLPWLAMILSIRVVHRRSGKKNFFRDIAAGLSTAFATSLLIGWIYASAMDYPYFLKY